MYIKWSHPFDDVMMGMYLFFLSTNEIMDPPLDMHWSIPLFHSFLIKSSQGIYLKCRLEDTTLHAALSFPSTGQGRFVHSYKATSIILSYLILIKHKVKGNIKEYIIKMFYLNSKLKAFSLDLSDNLLMHVIFYSLST